MLHRLALPLWLLLPAAIAAQQGTITYTYSVKYGFEIPERWGALRDQIPSSRSGTMLLHFDPSASLMTPAPEEEKEAAPAIVTDRPMLSDRAVGMVMRMRMAMSAMTGVRSWRLAISWDARSVSSATCPPSSGG